MKHEHERNMKEQEHERKVTGGNHVYCKYHTQELLKVCHQNLRCSLDIKASSPVTFYRQTMSLWTHQKLEIIVGPLS